MDPAVALSHALEGFNSVKDSGARQQWDTGSRRDIREGKGRFDLIPALFLRRLAKHFENGAKKYGDRNWEKGQPLSRYLDSALRHMMSVQEGLEDEDHLAAAAWNIQAIMWTLEEVRAGRLPRELADLPYACPDAIVRIDNTFLSAWKVAPETPTGPLGGLS